MGKCLIVTWAILCRCIYSIICIFPGIRNAYLVCWLVTVKKLCIFVSAWFVGDPHIHTLDNFQYTFNGLGEYTLIKTNGGNFTLQGRTVKALNDNGTETAATVFSAFAATDVDSDRVYIAMNSSRSGTYSSMLTNDSLFHLKCIYVIKCSYVCLWICLHQFLKYGLKIYSPMTLAVDL